MKAPTELIIVGNGMATGRLLTELMARCPERYRIRVFGNEPGGSYNRVLLSPLLGQEIDVEQLLTHPQAWYAEHGITLHSDCPIQRIDSARRQVIDADGQRYHYDRLVLATGSRPTQLNVNGESLPEVMGFRNLADVERLQQLAQPGQPAVVIGGGLLGLEAAEGLRRLGMNVTLVHRSPWLLNRQLDRQAAQLLQQQLEARGLTFRLGQQTRCFVGSERLEAVELGDASRLPATLAVVATGIAPNLELAQSAGLACDYAIQVAPTLQTSEPNIFALGECCQFGSSRYGMVAPIWQQAQVLAERLAGGDSRYQDAPFATQLKVSGIELFSFGQIEADSNTEVLSYLDPALPDYRQLLLRDNRLVGAVLYGDISSGQWYFDQFRQQAELGHCRDNLLFGADYCSNPRSDQHPVSESDASADATTCSTPPTNPSTDNEAA